MPSCQRPNTPYWNELTTRDLGAAKAFYRAVFGWGGQTQDFEGTTYTMWTVGDRPVGGMIQMNDQWPPDIPPHWMVYIAVADVDATVAKVAELGGTVPVPPTDAAFGRFAVCERPPRRRLLDRRRDNAGVLTGEPPPGTLAERRKGDTMTAADNAKRARDVYDLFNRMELDPILQGATEDVQVELVSFGLTFEGREGFSSS